MLAPLAASLAQPVISSVVKAISGGIVLRHSLSNIEITNYFKYQPRFKGVFSRNNLPRIKDGTYIINLDNKNSKGTHKVSLFTDRNTVVNFDSFGIKYIPLDVVNKFKHKLITHNIFRIQDKESITCGFYCIAVIEYVLAGKTLLGYTNLFSPNDYKKNDKIIYKHFKVKYGRSIQLRLRKIDETRNYLSDEIKHDLMSEKHER